jgi:hypothetical protein
MKRYAIWGRLQSHQPAPDGIALGPEVLAFVVEAHRLAIEHDTERDAVDPGHDTAVVQRRASVDRHAMRLRRVANDIGAGVDHLLEQHALVEPGAADQEIVSGPFAALVAAPGLAHPLAVRLEAAAGQHAAFRFDPLAPDAGGDEAPVPHFDRVDRRGVADLHAQGLGTAVVGVEQRLAAAHEKGIGTRQVQRARERRLELHAVPAHPAAAGRRGANHQPRELLVGEPAGDLEQVLPELLFGIGLQQHVLRRVVHAAQVAHVHRVAAAPLKRRRFQQQHAGTGLARHQRRAQGGVAAADH